MEISVKQVKPVFNITLSYEELAVLHLLVGNTDTEQVRKLSNEHYSFVSEEQLIRSEYNNYKIYDQLNSALKGVKI